MAQFQDLYTLAARDFVSSWVWPMTHLLSVKIYTFQSREGNEYFLYSPFGWCKAQSSSIHAITLASWGRPILHWNLLTILGFANCIIKAANSQGFLRHDLPSTSPMGTAKAIPLVWEADWSNTWESLRYLRYSSTSKAGYSWTYEPSRIFLFGKICKLHEGMWGAQVIL